MSISMRDVLKLPCMRNDRTAETAEIMFLHKNTIKYRLKKISGKLGGGGTDMPERLDLYQAIAPERLLED